MNVTEAIRNAEAILPGTPAPPDEMDPRWQAIIAVGEFIETEPDAVWDFVQRWGRHSDEDLRQAIATCLLEHLLDAHFDLVFPHVERLCRSSPAFAETFLFCCGFVQMVRPDRVIPLQALRNELTPSAGD